MTPEPTVQDETANNSDDSPADGIQGDHADQQECEHHQGSAALTVAVSPRDHNSGNASSVHHLRSTGFRDYTRGVFARCRRPDSLPPNQHLCSPWLKAINISPPMSAPSASAATAGIETENQSLFEQIVSDSMH
jgi:hypothetical protein